MLDSSLVKPTVNTHIVVATNDVKHVKQRRINEGSMLCVISYCTINAMKDVAITLNRTFKR